MIWVFFRPNHLRMKSIDDLINSPQRIKIFQLILLHQDTFTIKDVQIQLIKSGTEITTTTIQNLLRALCYRGYLEQFSVKMTPTRGRSTIHFKKSEMFMLIVSKNVQSKPTIIE